MKTTFATVAIGADFYYDNQGARAGHVYRKVSDQHAAILSTNGQAAQTFDFGPHEEVSVAVPEPTQVPPEQPPVAAAVVGDGGPAFPCEQSHEQFTYQGTQHLGMSLRDWFAGQALSIMSGYRQGDDCGQWAQRAYEMADAMLAARSKP